MKPIGGLIRTWRERRRLSQMALALDAGISARHLSFIETGRSRPSREVVLVLAEALDIPLRDRNGLLLAAGYSPAYSQLAYGDAAMGPARAAIQQILDGHDPYPAVLVDRLWNVQASNTGAALFLEDVDPSLLDPPVNVLRLSLHPKGLTSRILNRDEYARHALARLRRQVLLTADEDLEDLLDEVSAFEGVPALDSRDWLEGPGRLALSLRLLHRGEELAFFSTIATFGTALDVTTLGPPSSSAAGDSIRPADQ